MIFLPLFDCWQTLKAEDALQQVHTCLHLFDFFFSKHSLAGMKWLLQIKQCKWSYSTSSPFNLKAPFVFLLIKNRHTVIKAVRGAANHKMAARRKANQVFLERFQQEWRLKAWLSSFPSDYWHWGTNRYIFPPGVRSTSGRHVSLSPPASANTGKWGEITLNMSEDSIRHQTVHNALFRDVHNELN